MKWQISDVASDICSLLLAWPKIGSKFSHFFLSLTLDRPYPIGYYLYMIEIRKTERYAQWLDGLRDILARARIQVRVERLATGNPGDVKPVGEGVSELRIDYGPGYRVYFTKRGQKLVILLAGGDKRSQATDIKAALRLARNL